LASLSVAPAVAGRLPGGGDGQVAVGHLDVDVLAAETGQLGTDVGVGLVLEEIDGEPGGRRRR
jgi:hypothetical protein